MEGGRDQGELGWGERGEDGGKQPKINQGDPRGKNRATAAKGFPDLRKCQHRKQRQVNRQGEKIKWGEEVKMNHTAVENENSQANVRM